MPEALRGASYIVIGKARGRGKVSNGGMCWREIKSAAHCQRRRMKHRAFHGGK